MTLYRFDQIAANITIRVEPADTDLERYVGLEHLDPESLKLRRWGSPADVIGQKLRFWKGDIIYGKRRAYQRKLAVADFDGICSAHAMVLRAKQDVILPELLPFFLQSEIFHQRAMEISVGSLSPTINWSALAKQEFPLPPVDEQRRIADLLWAADDAIQRNQELLASLNLTRKSTIKHLLSYGVDENGKPRSVKNSDDFIKDSPIGIIPRKWSIIQLQDVFDLRSGSTPNRSQQERYFSNGTIPWVKTLDLNEGWISTTEEMITEIALKESSCSINPVNTVFVAMYGGFNQIGRTGILKVPAATNQAVCALLQKSKNILPEFAFYSLQDGRPRWRSVAASSRKDPNITRKDVCEFKIALPNTVDEQEKICQIIRQLDSTVEQANQHIMNSVNLKSKIINSTFR